MLAAIAIGITILVICILRITIARRRREEKDRQEDIERTNAYLDEYEARYGFNPYNDPR